MTDFWNDFCFFVIVATLFGCLLLANEVIKWYEKKKKEA